ncbi:MAG TPA: SDR family oxidoreductase [Myxococcota bacterium]|nr:SDR family oxidoreductase [Myxococcota bacterium]
MGKGVRKPRGRRVALVTGASSGIGEAFSRALARDGFDLMLVARRRHRLAVLGRELTKTHGVASEPFAADLSTEAGLRRVSERIAREPRLELLVNNAGLGAFGRFAGSEWSREESEIRVNVLAAVRLVHAALPRMIRRRRGAVINVSSAAAFTPAPSFAVYGATKAFLNSFTEALHVELRGTGVRVQALCPGLTHTEIFSSARADTSGLPEFLWMEPAEVVAESLAALARGSVLCVPGLGNRAVANLARMLPHSASSRIAELLGRSVKATRTQR